MAVAVALLARSRRTLSTDGAVAAVLAGTAAIAAGWSWGILLVAFFLSSSALSRVGVDIKERRTRGMLEKGRARDAGQVAANGGVFALAAALSLLHPWEGWRAVAAGALAAATADTWGTEVGTLSSSAPRSLTSGRSVQPGQSGGVTPLGSVATLAGAAFVAALAGLLGWGAGAAQGALVGGVAGAMTDSIAGSLVQSRRRCARCDVLTEQRVHTCGARTERAGGVAWLDNDGVNALSCVTGAGVALAWWAAR
ncbi:MAG: DUF92 domain-containing protein [Gemmatimonadaceae bacterium]